MKILFSDNFPNIIENKYIFLDNDFLSQLFYDEQIFTEAFQILRKCILLIDSFTAFEFLRDIYLPEQYSNKQQFISSELFSHASDHQEIYKHLQENALILSRIYAHHNQKSKSSLVDLFLAARLMYTKNSLLITGNKKDFPQCIFDTVGVLNLEQSGDSSMRAFSLITFNQSNFDKSVESLNKLDKK